MDEMGMGMGMEEVSHNEMTGEGGVPEAGTLTYKLEAMLIIFLCAMVGGLVPLRKNTGPRLLSLGNCFSGGIFLAAAFSHMLTEALEGFEKLEWHTEFPVIMFFTVVGILIPFFIERIVMEHDHTAILDRPRSADAGASETSTQQQFSIYALWLMLGVHSIIEGMALGVEDNNNDITAILIAILAHKFFSAFALGVSIVKAGLPLRRTLQLIATFACSVPSGILLGIIVSGTIQGFFNQLLTEIMKALAAGTFIYVALVEILLEEFEFGGHKHKTESDHHDEESHHSHADHHAGPKHTGKYEKFVAMLVGVGTMTMFSLFHSH